MTAPLNLALHRRTDADVQSPYLYPPYVSTRTRAPKRPLVFLPHAATELTGPVYGHERIGPHDHDLTAQHDGDPIGQRIIVSGRVLDEGGRPVPDTLVEIWQANAAGRYAHANDTTSPPLDPNFTGAGRTLTDREGRYRFVTIRPGSYAWGNHENAWRPAHIHFSLLGRAFAQRLVTQAYFPGDPLFDGDPIFEAVPDVRDRKRLIAAFDWATTVHGYAHGYTWDIVLRGREATPFEGR